jgi:hypothetical protein
MSSFGDELRRVIAKKADQLSVRDALAERARETAQRKRDELDAAAAAVVSEVFGPLVEEFYQALQAAGVLRSRKHSGPGRHVNGAHIYSLSVFGASRKAIYRIRIYAAATAEARIALKAEVRRRKEEKRAEEEPKRWTELFDEVPDSDPSSFSLHPSSFPSAPSSFILPPSSFPVKTVAPEHAKNPSVENWCREALKKCAAAVVEAERRKA